MYNSKVCASCFTYFTVFFKSSILLTKGFEQTLCDSFFFNLQKFYFLF